jgi:hypothetical protein
LLRGQVEGAYAARRARAAAVEQQEVDHSADHRRPVLGNGILHAVTCRRSRSHLPPLVAAERRNVERWLHHAVDAEHLVLSGLGDPSEYACGNVVVTITSAVDLVAGQDGDGTGARSARGRAAAASPGPRSSA